MYFGYVKEKYIELLYEKKKKKMTPENLGRHTKSARRRTRRGGVVRYFFHLVLSVFEPPLIIS